MALALALGGTLAEKVGVALPLPLAWLAVELGEGVPLPPLGVLLTASVCEGSALGEGSSEALSHTEKVGDCDAERLPLAHCEGDSVPLPVAEAHWLPLGDRLAIVCEGVALRECSGEALPHAVAAADCDAARLPLAHCDCDGVPLGVAEAHWLPLGVGEPEGDCDEGGDGEGEGVAPAGEAEAAREGEASALGLRAAEGDCEAEPDCEGEAEVDCCVSTRASCSARHEAASAAPQP